MEKYDVENAVPKAAKTPGSSRPILEEKHA